MRKRFVKLLLFKVDTQYRLLYGFSSETEQSSYLWKAFPADKKGQKLIVKAILSPSEADNFSINLTGTEPIMLCERVTLKSPQLYKREQLLYSDDEEQQTVPISEFCYLSEFWNREKHSLLSEIQNEFSADGRTRYEQTLELLEWAKCNCGIDFCMDGRRFGNYEVYYRTPENSSFEIDIHKDQGLRVTTIRKRKDFAEDIIVNCIGKYKDYVICNQTQVWPANKKEIYFEARALRISNEVLFSSETYRCQVQSETSAESAAERYLRQWYDELSNQICICKDDFSTVLTAVAERAQSDRIDACKMLCYALSNICTSQVESLTEMLQSTGGVKALFLSEFPNLAKAAEQQCDYLKCGASSPEYTLWALLNGKARPSPQGYHLLIDHAGHIHLRGLTWLTCGYHMALKLDITGFLTLLSQLRSPMMFDTLAFQMAISPLDRELYCAAACSELLYVRLLSAEWLFNAIRDERSQFEVAREIWNRFEPDVRALQEAIVLSNVVFHVRTRRLESEAQWQAIQEVLLSKLASDLPACSGEVINTALDWLHDSNAVSRATLLMTLAERMENSHPQKQLLARAERILKREIQDCQTASDIPRSIALYLNCVDALYGENAENHIFKDILDWNTFEDATEPELQNYDYHRSRNAFILAQRQIQILEGMLVKWPESEKAKAWLNAWACRLKQIPEKL